MRFRRIGVTSGPRDVSAILFDFILGPVSLIYGNDETNLALLRGGKTTPPGHFQMGVQAFKLGAVTADGGHE
jgi:hypothetical protein